METQKDRINKAQSIMSQHSGLIRGNFKITSKQGCAYLSRNMRMVRTQPNRTDTRKVYKMDITF